MHEKSGLPSALLILLVLLAGHHEQAEGDDESHLLRCSPELKTEKRREGHALAVLSAELGKICPGMGRFRSCSIKVSTEC